MRTTLLFCLALIVGLAPDVAAAGNGNAYGHDNGNGAGGNGNGNNGNGNGNGGSNGNASNGESNGDSSSANGKSNSPTSSVLSPEGLVTSGADQNIALDAVNSGAALPLDQIEPAAVHDWGGRVIDAKLLRVRGTLVYQLTVISDSGVSRRVYYDAHTGASIGGR